VKIQQAVACLDFLWNELPIVNRVLDMCLIQEELGRAPIDLTDEDLSAGSTDSGRPMACTAPRTPTAGWPHAA
jgi:hypothetical protein